MRYKVGDKVILTKNRATTEQAYLLNDIETIELIDDGRYLFEGYECPDVRDQDDDCHSFRGYSESEVISCKEVITKLKNFRRNINMAITKRLNQLEGL